MIDVYYKDYIVQRVIMAGKFTIENNATVRETANYIGVSRTTIHNDLKKRLPRINYSLYKEVNNILQKNKKERHIRGGNATREKYKKLNKEVEAS